MTETSGAEQRETRAAGAVLWRPAAARLSGPGTAPGPELAPGPEVALVHRSRYDDWSLPKGKSLPGEHVLLTAVREVEEETGIRVVLGRRLPSTRYPRNGGLKVVDYWAAQPAGGPQPRFTPNDEVDQVDWLPVPAARQRLSYPHDWNVLDAFAAGPPDSIPLILLRHASAGNKRAWAAAGHPDDLARPLDPVGRRQAEALAQVLACYARGRVLSSLAERCVATVRPYAARHGLEIGTDPALTVGRGDDATAARLIEAVLSSGQPTMICGHRENLPVLTERASALLDAKIPDGQTLPLAGFRVLQISAGTLASAELHDPPVRAPADD